MNMDISNTFLYSEERLPSDKVGAIVLLAVAQADLIKKVSEENLLSRAEIGELVQNMLFSQAVKTAWKIPSVHCLSTIFEDDSIMAKALEEALNEK